MKNTYVCKVCKKEFKKYPSQLRGGTCSKKCGLKIREYKPNSGQFKKGNKPWLTGKKMPQWIKKKLSDAHQKSEKGKGELHWKWQGGTRSYYTSQARKILLQHNIPKKCFICGTTDKRIHTHHKDRNWKNNKLNNIMFICISCHLILHHKEDKVKNMCQWCNKIFYTKRVRSKFCSSSCRNKDWKYNKLTARK